jgi:hypothetical protein
MKNKTNKPDKALSTVKSTATANPSLTIPSLVNLSSDASIGLPSSRVTLSSRNSNKYMSYSGDGANRGRLNLYPQELTRLAYDAPTHFAALSRKAFMTKGRGIDKSKLSKALQRVFKNLNPYGDTIDDILERVSWDYVILGAIALKVTWGNDGYIKYVEHVPAGNVRVGVPDAYGNVTQYVISNNWDNSLSNSLERTYSLPAFNPSYFGKDSIQLNNGVPTPNEDQVNNAEQLIYLFDYKPHSTGIFEYYPVPDYIGAIDAISTEIEIGISNKSILDNGLGAKYIVTFPENLYSDEKKMMYDYDLKASFAGAKHNGGLITMYSDKGSDSLPKIDMTPSADANTYLEVDKQVKQSIITAHNIPAILLEYNQGGGFNNRAEEMVVAYEQFQATKIQSYQDFILKCLNSVTTYLGWEDSELAIIPFSMLPAEAALAPQAVISPSDAVVTDSTVTDTTSLIQ